MNNVITHSSQNYAQALFETGATFENDILSVLDTLQASSDLKNIISNPSIDLSIKNNILDEIFKDKIDEKVLQFIKILTEKSRITELKEICHAYREKVNDANGLQQVEIISAIELDEATKNKIITKLNEKLNKKIIPTWKIDKEIISGLIFKLGDNIIDTSLKTKIENISKNIR